MSDLLAVAVFFACCAALGYALGLATEYRGRKQRAAVAATYLDVLKPGWRDKP